MNPTGEENSDPVLPKFERDGSTGSAEVRWPWNSECMRLSDLSALLAALDPATRARVLEPYLSDVANVLRPKLADCEEALSVARAEVERLKTFLRSSVTTVRTSPHEPFLVCLGCGAADGEDCATACWVYELEGLVAEPEPKEPTT